MRTLKFIINPMNVVDLVAFAPFWILGGMDDPPFAVPSLDSPGGSAFGFVRAIRLVRVFRVFKVGKLALGFKMMAGSITNSMETMSVLMIVMGVVVTLFSSIMHLIEAPGCDCAVLDINLGSEMADPVAERLTALGLPFVTVSGYAPPQQPAAFRGAPFLPKPVQLPALTGELERLLAGEPRGARL